MEGTLVKRESALHDSKKVIIAVGTATCGKAAGALDTFRVIQEEVKKLNLACDVIEVGCMGYCYAEPLVLIRKPFKHAVLFKNIDMVNARFLIYEYLCRNNPCSHHALGIYSEGDSVIEQPSDQVSSYWHIPKLSSLPRGKEEKRIILKNCGIIDPTNIFHYIANEGYEALRKIVKMSPESIIDELDTSKLRGRGGTGFNTAKKWSLCRQAITSKNDNKHSHKRDNAYVVCNADEGDPGAFADRVLLESDPHSIIEGMVIAAYVIGANKGIVFVRSEYPLASNRVRHAVEQAKKQGFLGSDILGIQDFDFNIEVFEGAGAFVCGMQ